MTRIDNRAIDRETTRPLADLLADRALLIFYGAVLCVALVGASQSAHRLLGWWLPAAAGAVLLTELGGVALAAFADSRRRRGERALVARVLSAVWVVGAVALQLRGHADPRTGGPTAASVFFAGFSAAGYCVYLLHSSARRRDALRAAGKLPEPPPVYGLWQWVRHPWLTRRARAIAVANAEIRLVERIAAREAGRPEQPTTELLGRAGSLAAAAAEISAARRIAAIRRALRRRITAGVDSTLATIAVHTYDLDRIARQVAASADYTGLAGLISAELTAERIAEGITQRRRRRWWWRTPVEPARETTPAEVETSRAAVSTAPRPAAVEAASPVVAASPARGRSAVVSARVRRESPVSVSRARRVSPQVTVETDSRETPPETGQTPRETTAETTAETAAAETPQAAARETDTPAAAGLPEIAASLVPHLARVMARRPDWATAISLPRTDPDALSYAKIKQAAGITGQQTCSKISSALRALAAQPAAAEAYILRRATA